MTTYFKECKTKAELKVRFKELLKVNHPDNGGDVQIMQKINAEYDKLLKILPEKEKENKKATKENNTSNLSKALQDAIRKVSIIPGLNVEVCGTWIWVSGNTYPAKELLKNASFKFSGKKKMWYFHEETESVYKRWHKKETDMETIRNKYGSSAVHGQAACLA